jgi:hypothetical protein
MMDLEALTKEELLALLQQAMDTIDAQQARINTLEQELARFKDGSAPPPSQKPVPPAFVKPNVPKRPSKARKKRSHSFVRKRQQPTKILTHWSEPHFPYQRFKQVTTGSG